MKITIFHFTFVKCALNQSLCFSLYISWRLAVFWEHIFRTALQRLGPPVAYILTSAGQKGIKITGLKVILLSVMQKNHFSMEKIMFSNVEIWCQERRLSESPWLQQWCLTVLADWKLSLRCRMEKVLPDNDISHQ